MSVCVGVSLGECARARQDFITFGTCVRRQVDKSIWRSSLRCVFLDPFCYFNASHFGAHVLARDSGCDNYFYFCAFIGDRVILQVENVQRVTTTYIPATQRCSSARLPADEFLLTYKNSFDFY